MTITEKIDGTNGQIFVSQLFNKAPMFAVRMVGSRKRAITPEQDNFGFAKWVAENEHLAEVLREGRHFGEWAGPGIQKNPLNLKERLFFLFNSQHWPYELITWAREKVPQLRVVPVLYSGPFNIDEVRNQADLLQAYGSRVSDAGRGNRPEGIVVSAFKTKFKFTPDDISKGLR